MIRRPPRSTRTDTLFPYTTLFRAQGRRGREINMGRQPSAKPTSFDIAYLAGVSQPTVRSEEHTSELQSLMRISYAVFCLKKNNDISPIRTCESPTANQLTSQRQYRQVSMGAWSTAENTCQLT